MSNNKILFVDLDGAVDIFKNSPSSQFKSVNKTLLSNLIPFS